MIHLDTSVLVDALAGPCRSAAALRRVIEGGERMAICTLVLYEWSRGPRRPQELQVQRALFPDEQAVALGPREALLAAKLYGTLRKPRGREIDLAIAACALSQGATLWTLNAEDFADVPTLRVIATP